VRADVQAQLPAHLNQAAVVWPLPTFLLTISPHIPSCLTEVPPGKFWELNVVRDCPFGLYRSDFVRTDSRAAISCLSCPKGWTTSGKGKGAKSDCNKLMPGYMVAGAYALHVPLSS